MAKRDGAAFEARVHGAMEAGVTSGLFGLEASKCTLVRAPRYYSRDRGSDIVFDLGLEMRLEAGTAPFVTIVVECKDYSGPIPVDDVEEFKAKLDQCFGKNVKGMFVSSGALQEGAVAYARSNGICVARLLPDDVMAVSQYMLAAAPREQQAQWIREQHEDEVPEALTSPDFAMQSCEFGDFDFFAAVGDINIVDVAEAIAVVAGLQEPNQWDFSEIVEVLALEDDEAAAVEAPLTASV